MRIQYLIIILIFGIFCQQGWAPPPGKGGAAAAPDISKCDLNPSKQTKLKVKGEDGKVHFVCTGPIICEGKAIELSCRVNEGDSCPGVSKCVIFSKQTPDSFGFVVHKFDISVGKKPELDLKKIEPMAPSIISSKLVDLKIPTSENIQGIKILASGSSNIKLEEKTRTTVTPGKSYEVLENNPQYKAIGFFRGTTTGNIVKSCTGTLIKNPNSQAKTKWAILTAASCVYDRATDTWIRKGLGFAPNFHFNREIIISLKFAAVPYEFLNPANRNYQAFDYAIVAVDGEPSADCCLNLMIVGTSPDSYSGIFPIKSEAIQLIQSRANLFLFETKMEEFEPSGTYDPNYFRKVKNDINLAYGLGGPWVGKNPQNGQEGFVFGLNIGHPERQIGIVVSPVLGKTFEKMWKCIEDETKACPEMDR